MDLPVLAVATRVSAQGFAADAETRRAVKFIAIVMRDEPGLLGWISEVGIHGGDVRLVLRNGADAEVLVGAEPEAARLHELHLTLADLATPRFIASSDSATMRNAEAELARVKRIDVRYHDQVVVALHGRESWACGRTSWPDSISGRRRPVRSSRKWWPSRAAAAA
jgi:hypothetical protein